MRTVTGYWRWLLVAAVAVGFAGSAHAQRTVTLHLNTATLPDTLNPASVIKVMGAVGGTAPFTLPDGRVISWDVSGASMSTLDVENVGGDYWETTFQVPEDENMQFKFYSQRAESDGIGGWEDGENHVLPAGTGDTTLVWHYFEKGPDQAYEWSPFEQKEDSIGVMYRVAMYGDESRSDSYDPAASAPQQVVGIRGDGLGGASPLSWDVTNVALQREATADNVPGYNIYSGIVYYPRSAAGTRQPYKFVLDRNGVTSWEEGNVSGDRAFVIPEQDTTLHWVYYGNTAPSLVDPVESLVIFTVDLSPFEEIGLFDRARGDTLWVYGSFNDWQNCPTLNPDLCLMSHVPGENQFELAVPMLEVPNKLVHFKYFLDFNDETFRDVYGEDPPSGWEEGHATGTNRTFEYAATAQQVLDLAFYNDITSDNVIPDNWSVDVHFSVDMRAAFANQADPFDPAGGDSVTIRVADPVWAFTQGVNGDPRSDSDFPLFIDKLVLEDADGDSVYTGTLAVEGPTYSSLTYRYAYGQASNFFEEVGTDASTPGRNRVHYIKKNGDGSWPSNHTLPTHTFHLETGPLPFETNPAFGTSVEPVDGALPAQVSLSQNYPNPFNPTTSFEYSLSATQHVKVRVYDVLGRVVATLVDGTQPAATYRVTFDATHLASGVYVYQLQTPGQVITRKMMLVK